MEYTEFVAGLVGRPLPTAPIARLRTYARELAEGAVAEAWHPTIDLFRGGIVNTSLQHYHAQRWDDAPPPWMLLAAQGYLMIGENNTLLLTPAAFALLNEAPPARAFISYSRRTSSALALLVQARLRLAGLDAFVDLAIQPGDNWPDILHTAIREREAFILLLAPGTLDSVIIQQEIAWAQAAGKTILPVWHGGFRYPAAEAALPAAIDHLLTTTHTIRVLEESAAAYHTALTELLNFFGAV